MKSLPWGSLKPLCLSNSKICRRNEVFLFYPLTFIGLTQLCLKTFLEAESEAIWVDLPTYLAKTSFQEGELRNSYFIDLAVFSQ
jgi:hypothetical protein